MHANDIKKMGYRVFVQTDTGYHYGYFSDGTNVAYFQLASFGVGVIFTSVNRQPGSSCSGFGINKDADLGDVEPTKELCELALKTVFPSWVTSFERERMRVVKYKNLDEFLANYWNAGKLVEI